MTPISETGHARNLANFATLITICEANHTHYQPTNPALTISALHQLHTRATQAIDATHEAKTRLSQAINHRAKLYSTLRTTATRILNAVKASGASKEYIADVKSINRKIQGKRATPKPAEDSGKKTISSTQLSFDYQLFNFTSLVILLEAEPLYAPNEPTLQVATLQQYIHQLSQANSAVIDTNTTYRNALGNRNQILYAPTTGILAIVRSIKAYIKSVYGTSSYQYKEICKLHFKKV